MIAVGNEFGAVEALWSQFEGVMAQEPEEEEGKEAGTDGSGEEEEEEVESAGEAEQVDEQGRNR